jgi:regulator of sirC expression with transglutaminase-like and TPR domain
MNLLQKRGKSNISRQISILALLTASSLVLSGNDLAGKDANAYTLRGGAKYELGDKSGALEDLSQAGELGLEEASKAIRKIQKP